ncbi:hypothetical protein SAMN02910317_02401 [Ruminococcaceae bacterium FB2012]|nr:hypothetical protein SAMN02910317_02401 [Ruminococcaceae bacterium FB2012]
MLILIDDIKLGSKEEFFAYVSTQIEGKEINSIDDLREYLLSTDRETELILSDIDEAEDQKFAEDLKLLLEGVSSTNSNIKFTLM